MHRSLERRLAALEQATTPPDERPMITIVVYDETPDRIVRMVTVPVGPSGDTLDYRQALRRLYGARNSRNGTPTFGRLTHSFKAALPSFRVRPRALAHSRGQCGYTRSCRSGTNCALC